MNPILQAGCILLSAAALCGSLLAGQLQPLNLQAADKVDGVAIVVTRFGPYPSAIVHSPAPFLLSIVNRSGVREDTFSLVPKPPAGAAPDSLSSLLDLHATASRQRDHQIIQPLPGSYQLVFKSHPDWIVSITITAN